MFKTEYFQKKKKLYEILFQDLKTFLQIIAYLTIYGLMKIKFFFIIKEKNFSITIINANFDQYTKMKTLLHILSI